MESKAFIQMVVADCLQRHQQRVDAASQRISVLANDLDSARTQLDRAIDDQDAFKRFVMNNQPPKDPT